MSNDISDERRARAAEEAAKWLVAIQSNDLSSQGRADFIDWLRECPLHVSEVLHACRIYRDLNSFPRWRQITASDREFGRIVSLVARKEPVDPDFVEAGQRRQRFRRSIGMTLGAAAAAVCTIIAMVWLGQTTTYRTPLGERREVTLRDGSVVVLAPLSIVRVRYRAHSRSVVLEQGQALFHVAKNSERPFTVDASGTRVRAVGTAFDVDRTEQSVSVTVVEGRVTVTKQPDEQESGTASTGAGVSLGADEQIVISATGKLNAIHKVKGELEIAWTAGQLVFDNESVADIARRFNLYNRTKIVLLDKGLAARRISGMFRATDPDSFVAFIQSAGGIHVERQGVDQIILGRASPAGEGATGP